MRVLLCLLLIQSVLSFRLIIHPNSRKCFNTEVTDIDSRLHVDVTIFGAQDGDEEIIRVEILSPSGLEEAFIHEEAHAPEDVRHYTVHTPGVWTICLDNTKYSASKLLSFLFETEPPVITKGDVTSLEYRSTDIHNILQDVFEETEHLRTREAKRSQIAAMNNKRVSIFSSILTVLIIVINIAQFKIITNFFRKPRIH